MAKIYEVCANPGTKYEITLTAMECGEDYSVNILGGERRHVGAVALGFPCPEYEEKAHCATVSSISAPEHRDDEAARFAARFLATELRRNVSVTAGIHIENASAKEIKFILESCKGLCERFAEAEKK